MTLEELKELFDTEVEEIGGEFLKFERVKVKLSSRPDVHAFLLLDTLVPGNSDMVANAQHDEIFLGVELENLVENDITKEQVIDLIRCGVRYDDDVDSLAMFV